LENGQVLELDENSAQIVGEVPGGYVFVDGLGIGDVGSVVLRDRYQLSQDGFLIAVLAVNRKTGELAAEPEPITRGFVYLPESEAMMEEAKGRLTKAFQRRRGHPSGLESRIHDLLSNFLYERTRRRPMILPVVLQV